MPAESNDADERIERILTEQRRLQLRISEQNRMLRERQQNLLSTLEQLQQREADATQMAVVAQEALAELRSAQERLLRSEKLAAIGHLAAAMSHELRNPLGAIRNAWFYINHRIAQEQLQDRDPRIDQLSKIIDVELDRCARIIGDLLDFSRERPVFRSRVSLKQLVQDAIGAVALPARTITIVDETSAELREPFVDVDQFRQILVNLLQNAVEVVDPERGRVTVRVSEHDGWFTLEVEDNGPGIPPEVKPRIFEPLFTTKTRGTGLGLSIVASIVQRHGGTIDVATEPGGGSNFIIRFPGGEQSTDVPTAVGGAADLRVIRE